MSVTKNVILVAMFAGLLGGTARGDAILTLGLFSSVSAPSTGVPTSTAQGFNLASTDATNHVAPTPSSSAIFSAQAASPAPSAPPVSSAPRYDAFINFGNGPFSDASSLTSGNAQAWYNSPKVAGLFGGQPTAGQVASFDSTVLQRVQQTFALSGVPVTLTDDPNASAAHMLSVVSNTVNPSMTNAIGMTNIGGNGFHFIDNSAPYAGSVDQLEWIVAHNVAHELMLAFGVPEVNDKTGHYIDSTVGQMAMFLNPYSTFSPGAVQDLLASNFQQSGSSLLSTEAQLVGGDQVPEPATLAAWTLVAGALFAARRARSRRASA